MVDRRNMGQRRWGLDDGFPLKDSDGMTIITERRGMTDRRLMNTSLEERLTMFSGMLPLDPEWKKKH